MSKHIIDINGKYGWHKVNRLFLLAALPSALFGIWNTGFQIATAMATISAPGLSGWQGLWFTKSVLSDSGAITHFLLGLSYFLPLLVVSFSSCLFWDWQFARLRKRVRDNGNLLVSLLFVLLLPATMPLGLAVVGVSFGLIFGKLIFGGSGHYLVNPSLLGILFLYYSYPGFFNGQVSFLPISGEITQSTWQLLAEAGVHSNLDSNFTWMKLFIGNEIGAIGTTSALASSIGLGILVAVKKLSWRMPVGAIFGLVLASLLMYTPGNSPAWQIDWFWHLVVGCFAFSLVFIATDLTVSPLSHGGAFIYGGIFGFLTVIIRTANPNHPDGTLPALLLASLLVPLIDWLVIEAHRKIVHHKRRVKRETEIT